MFDKHTDSMLRYIPMVRLSCQSIQKELPVAGPVGGNVLGALKISRYFFKALYCHELSGADREVHVLWHAIKTRRKP